MEVKTDTDSNDAMEIKTEADSNDTTACLHDGGPSTGMFGIYHAVLSAFRQNLYFSTRCCS